MAKVISIVCGQYTTRIAEVDYRTKTPRVYRCLEILTPEGAVEDGYILQPKELAKDLTKALKEEGIKTKKVVFSVASGRIASREATLPYVKQSKLEEVVDASAADYFPVDISEFKVTYQIMDTPEEPDGTKKYRVALLIAPNDLLDTYTSFAKLCNFDVLAIDYLSNSVSTVLKEILQTDVCMAINIRNNNTYLFVFREGTVVLSRTIPTGIKETIDTVMELEAEETGAPVSYKTAVKKLRRSRCINATERDEQAEEEETTVQFRQEVTDTLGMFGNSITRVMDYYNSRNVEQPIDRVYLTGFAENFIGLPEYLSEEMGVAVELLTQVASGIDFGMEENPGAYISNVGAAIDSIDLLIDSKEEKKKRKRSSDGKNGIGNAADNSKYLVWGGIVCAIFLILSGVLAGISVSSYMKVKKENDQLKTREQELLPIIPVYEDNIRSALVLEEAIRIYNSTESQNDNLNLFIRELERILPSNVNVLSFSSDHVGVSINMNVDSKEAAAMVIDEFRKFDSLVNVRVASISEEVDELGLSNVVNFSIEAEYAPVLGKTFRDDQIVEEDKNTEGNQTVSEDQTAVEGE